MSSKNSTQQPPRFRAILSHGLFRLSVAGLLFILAVGALAKYLA